MENLKEEIQLIACQIVSAVGAAKSMYMEAIALAKEGEIEAAKEKIKEGRNFYLESHNHHFDLIQKEAGGGDMPFSLMLMHAEDQLLSTETIEIMATEMIDIHEKMKNL